ncbi:hypothetical protein D915_007042 [Fasciola hepatica]|uniref:Uncharacterized protein n=1 Tax=Fasciola hepatica TaxID=6192 RepID=A0A4E0R684_FASHE|nr:hypothetical protein D915_007042 [Fasciola hepatica]
MVYTSYLTRLTQQSGSIQTFGDDVEQTRNVYKVCLQESIRGAILSNQAVSGEDNSDWRRCIIDPNCKRMLYDCLATGLSQPSFVNNRYAQTMLRSINRLNPESTIAPTKRL